ncbi:hypothetical protein V6N11_022736 [Hibiscus sabdariffa]|uniref:Uncharacterized protein n=1 Tax=Hibiscus sabdariffa TaxID=183260 RepID=A0ABR2TKV0_9ROSI
MSAGSKGRKVLKLVKSDENSTKILNKEIGESSEQGKANGKWNHDQPQATGNSKKVTIMEDTRITANLKEKSDSFNISDKIGSHESDYEYCTKQADNTKAKKSLEIIGDIHESRTSGENKNENNGKYSDALMELDSNLWEHGG